MNLRPLILTAQEARGIADGTLTEIRRPVMPTVKGDCPYGVVGDRLWCRETWCSGIGLAHVESPEQLMAPAGAAAAPRIIYAADGATLPHGCRWRSSVEMPRWASRSTIEIASVRVERAEVWEWVLGVRKVTL